MTDLFNSTNTSSTPNKKDYSAKDIEVLEGLEPVRHRPGMYIGGTDEKALHHLASEIIDNSMDEAVAGYASNVDVILSKDGTLTVRDNGRGIPTDPHPKFEDKSALEVILTTLHSGGKFKEGAYATSGGLHGVGLSVVNALSDDLIVEVKREGFIWSQSYKKGIPQGPLLKGEKARGRGTTIVFHPDTEIFGENLHFKPEILHRLSRSKAYLRKGVTIKWACDKELLEGTKVPEKDEFYFPNGIGDFLGEVVAGKEAISPQPFEGESVFPEQKGRIEWAITWLENEDPYLRSYCNTIPTPLGGTHENGFRSALLKSIREYCERKKNKLGAKLLGDDILAYASGIVSVFIKDPQFQGQTKEKLSTASVTRLVENAIKDHFDHWLAQQPEVAERIVEIAIHAANERQRIKAQREASRKTPTQRLRLPGKLADCSDKSRQGSELFLVEGDSAGGSAKQSRDRRIQAILPLRGKILNVVSSSQDKLQANQEINDLIQALGCGTRGKYQENNLRYEKVIIMTDADVDGAHIASLLMTFFYREMRELIENGHLFLARPPLYRLTQGEKTIYVYSDQEKDHALEKEFTKKGKVNISRFKGLGEMNTKQLKETTMDPKTRTLLKVSLSDIEGEGARSIEEFVHELMGKKPEARFAFIQENAKFVEDIDL